MCHGNPGSWNEFLDPSSHFLDSLNPVMNNKDLPIPSHFLGNRLFYYKVIIAGNKCLDRLTMFGGTGDHG